MANEVKRKIVALNGSIKTKVVDGERRIVFVASSANQDRHYEHVNVSSLRLPLKGGGEISVDAIPAEGVSDIVDIPLMLNHSGDVRDVIGSVRSAFFENSELIFEAGISSREIAQEMLTLIEEGHLSNSFSITMIDYDYNFDAETISNAEVIEVSLVYRGSNKESRLLAIKSLIGGTNMPQAIEKQNDTFGTANGDGKDHNPSAEPAETPKEEKPAETTETPKEPQSEEAPAETPKSEESEEAPAETENEKTTDEETNVNPEEDKEMSKEIAKDSVVEKSKQPFQEAKGVSGYLDSKKALHDFGRLIKTMHGSTSEQVMQAWSESLKSKVITGDAILPSRLESIFFETWQTNEGALAAFDFTGARAGAVYAMEKDSGARGHVKGTTKVNQQLNAIRRDVKALMIYKKLPIDLQDLFDDETGALLEMRARELANLVANQIVVAALIGGEGAVGTPSGNLRGLFPILADSTAAAGTFGAYVTTAIAGAAGDNGYATAVKTIGAIRGNGAKTLFVPFGFKTDLLLATNDNGGALFPIGTNLETTLGVRIVEMDELVASGLIIGVLDGAYKIFGESSATMRTDFDMTVNQDVALVERFAGGSLTGWKTAAVYTPAA